MCKINIMNNLDYDSNLSRIDGNLSHESVGFSGRNNNNSLCVTSTCIPSSSNIKNPKINNKLENYDINNNCILDVLENDVKNCSKSIDDRNSNSPKIGVVQNDSSDVNKLCKSLETRSKRVVLSDIDIMEDMCDRSDKNISGTSTPGVRKMSILDILMNRDNCLDDISENISEVYSSLTSSINRYETCLNTLKSDYLNVEDEHTTSTTDYDYSHSDINQTQTEDTTIVEGDYPDDEMNEDVDVFDELIKCITSKDYFEKIEKPPPLSELDSEKLIRLEEVLNPILENLENLSNETSFPYKLYIMNISIQIVKEECKLNVEHMYNNLINILNYTSGCKNYLSLNLNLNCSFSMEEEMFLTLLNNSLSFVDFLKLDELVGLFRVLFPFFYNIYSVDIVSLKIFEICKEVVKRLQLEQIQELLKFVRSNLIYFNCSMYNNNIDGNINKVKNSDSKNNRDISSSTNKTSTTTQNISNKDSKEKEVQVDNPNNTYFVNMILLLFERIFVNGKYGVNNMGDDVEFLKRMEIDDEKESYGLFRQNLRVFVEEGFYNQNISFRNYKIFVLMLIESMEVSRNLFCPFLILEMGNIFINNLDSDENKKRENRNGNNNNNKDSKTDKINRIDKKEKEIRKLQSLKLLLIISDYIYKLYNRIMDLEFIDYHETKYIDRNTNKNNSNKDSREYNYEMQLDEMNVFRGMELENVKEYIMSYISYISIQKISIENEIKKENTKNGEKIKYIERINDKKDNKNTTNQLNNSSNDDKENGEDYKRKDKISYYLFYVLLKYYCYVNNVQGVEDLMSILKIFKYLYKYNDKFRGRDFGKIIVNINYPYVFNYPYLPGYIGYGYYSKYGMGIEYDIGNTNNTIYELDNMSKEMNRDSNSSSTDKTSTTNQNNTNNSKKRKYTYVYVGNGNMGSKVDFLGYNIYVYYVLNELYDSVMDCVVNIIYGSNENSLLRSAIHFIANVISRNPEYLLNSNMQNLLSVSLSDYNVYVRQQVIGIYSEFLVQFSSFINNKSNSNGDSNSSSTDKTSITNQNKNGKENKVKKEDNKRLYENELLKYISKEVLNKLLICTKDVNYKIRLESIKVFHMFLSIVDISNYFDVIGVLAQRSLESYREQVMVKNSLYSLLSSVFFVYAPEIFDSRMEENSTKITYELDNNDDSNSSSTDKTSTTNQNISNKDSSEQVLDESKMGILEELVKIILYKMESYKGKANPVLIMVNYYNSNYSLVNNPILYFCNDYSFNNNINKDSKRKRNNKLDNSNTNRTRRYSNSSTNNKDKDSKENDDVRKNSEKVVNIWLDNMLDLFLLKRSKGSNYYELAEILSVFKLFGEVYPRLFLKHLIYFTPYLKIINECKMDLNQVNLIILINNLVVIVYKYLRDNSNGDHNSSSTDKTSTTNQNNTNNSNISKQDDDIIWYELNSINNSVMGLINYNSPILIRSIIQLLSYNNQECVMMIYDISYRYLVDVRTKISKLVSNINSSYNGDSNSSSTDKTSTTTQNNTNNSNGNNKDTKRIIMENKSLVDINVYKYSWQLGCVCEFNEVDLKAFELFVEMYKYYSEFKIYNISGLFIECSCRYLSNLDNLYLVDLNGLKKLLYDLYEYSVKDFYNCSNNLVMILYQLLNNYQILSSTSKNNINNNSDNSNKDNGDSNSSSTDKTSTTNQNNTNNKESKKKELLNMVYVVVQKYIGVFVRLVVSYFSTNSSNNNGEDRDNTTNQLNNNNTIDSNSNITSNNNNNKDSKEIDSDRCVLYMEIIEIIIVNRLTSVQELLPFVFSQLISSNSQVQRIGEHNLKLIIKNDVNLFLNRLNTCFSTLFHNIVNQFFEYNFLLGVTGLNTHSVVQSIFRIYLEVLQTKRSNVKLFVTSLLLQTKSILNQDMIGNILGIIRRNKEFKYYMIYGNKGKNKGLSNKLSNLIDKIVKKEGEERNELVLEYFLYLYSNLICVVLDGLSFNKKSDANYVVSKIHDIVNDNNHILSKYQKINTFTHIKLKNISGKIKNIYK